jgi:hypothetical protein
MRPAPQNELAGHHFGGNGKSVNCTVIAQPAEQIHNGPIGAASGMADGPLHGIQHHCQVYVIQWPVVFRVASVVRLNIPLNRREQDRSPFDEA